MYKLLIVKIILKPRIKATELISTRIWVIDIGEFLFSYIWKNFKLDGQESCLKTLEIKFVLVRTALLRASAIECRNVRESF